MEENSAEQLSKHHQKHISRSEVVSTHDIPPRQAFERFVNTTIPDGASDIEAIGAIQEAARLFNETNDPSRNVQVLFHFTDNEGAENLLRSTTIDPGPNQRLYLTRVSPHEATPLLSAEEAREFEKYFISGKMPTSLKGKIKRFITNVKLKWNYHVAYRHRKTITVPVGGHKLENAIVLIADSNCDALNTDKQGEIYLENPVLFESDPNFEIFGPFRTA